MQNNCDVCDPMDMDLKSDAMIGPSRPTAPVQTSSSSAFWKSVLSLLRFDCTYS